MIEFWGWDVGGEGFDDVVRGRGGNCLQTTRNAQVRERRRYKEGAKYQHTKKGEQIGDLEGHYLGQPKHAA